MYMTEAVMSFNRASVMFFGAKHKKIWDCIMKWVWLIVTVPSLGVTWNLWLQNVTIDHKDPAHPELGYDWATRKPEQFFNLYMGLPLFPLKYFVVDAVHFTVPWMFLYTQRDVKTAVKTVIHRMFNMQTQVSVMNHFSQITLM
uniref:Serpentine receptor class gamma n=1 Tax=Panagrellus redivivus TaxID=6233 RepID=A0A7E4VF41_PANRE